MLIKENLLYSVGATEEHYSPGDYIFREEAIPQFYYQIVRGTVKLNSYNDDGKEFIQNIFSDESTFGESMLFLGKAYPVNAVSISECTILKVSREQLFLLMDAYPFISIDLCKLLSARTYDKYVLMRKITSKNAEERLKEIMDLFKEPYGNKEKFSFEIPYTRQQLGSFTGICVETVIRAIKRLEKNNVLMIRNRKIFY
ncbi:Crp/Fnr family transcriptional regulator [Chryseobacterium indoltheticum]|uniref:cAMP regulatory protein n=1 Tax=Chryseobacterium indoltheticum TaxID=254 RepID=A0A381FQC4_9FLAO|nr:Crp/Fnr family transcriptional regulator [Chryseobacterium indoltheticum]SUX48717.1 cAMP regulatory protein [Chryseobacterium indoltheticum]